MPNPRPAREARGKHSPVRETHPVSLTPTPIRQGRLGVTTRGSTPMTRNHRAEVLQESPVTPVGNVWDSESGKGAKSRTARGWEPPQGEQNKTRRNCRWRMYVRHAMYVAPHCPLPHHVRRTVFRQNSQVLFSFPITLLVDWYNLFDQHARVPMAHANHT